MVSIGQFLWLDQPFHDVDLRQEITYLPHYFATTVGYRGRAHSAHASRYMINRRVTDRGDRSDMRDVRYWYGTGTELGLHRLRGLFLPIGLPGLPAVKEAFELRLVTALEEGEEEEGRVLPVSR